MVIKPFYLSSRKKYPKKKKKRKKESSTAQRNRNSQGREWWIVRQSVKKGLFCTFYSLHRVQGHHRVETATLPSVHAILLLLLVLRSLEVSRVNCQAYAPLPFFPSFFSSGSNWARGQGGEKNELAALLRVARGGGSKAFLSLVTTHPST